MKKLSNIILVILVTISVNAIPAFGVYSGEINVDKIIFIYWLELIIGGIFTYLKMIKCEINEGIFSIKSNYMANSFLIIHLSIILFTSIIIFIFFENLINLKYIIYALTGFFFSYGLSYYDFLKKEKHSKELARSYFIRSIARSMMVVMVLYVVGFSYNYFIGFVALILIKVIIDLFFNFVNIFKHNNLIAQET